MTWHIDDDERRELIRRLFFLIGTRLEDAATAAGDGQASTICSEAAAKLARQLHSAGQEIAIVADAVMAILSSVRR